MTTPATSYSDDSVRSAAALPNRLVRSSVDTGWRSLLLEHSANDGVSDPFDVLPTRDQTIVLTLKGTHDLDVFDSGRWRSAKMSAGCLGFTRPDDGCRLRSLGPANGDCFETAHVYIPTIVFEEAFADLAPSGRHWRYSMPEYAGTTDNVIRQAIEALLRGMERGVGDLYAQSASQWLAVHLLSTARVLDRDGLDRALAGRLDDRRLARAIDAMAAHLDRDLSLDWLASEARISKFHFTRMFRRATGRTPWQYLTELRMQAAHRLLTTSGLSVAEVARRVGYPRANNFAAAFVRRFATTPRDVRGSRRALPATTRSGDRDAPA